MLHYEKDKAPLEAFTPGMPCLIMRPTSMVPGLYESENDPTCVLLVARGPNDQNYEMHWVDGSEVAMLYKEGDLIVPSGEGGRL